jgi:hypothetical protein
VLMRAMATWSGRHWTTALVGALVTMLLIGLPTDVIPNPVFGRPVPVTWWSYPMLAVTAVLSGLLLATYVRVQDPDDAEPAGTALDLTDDRQARAGGLGALLTFFAVGCPVCNKVVVLAIGTVGARAWFEPLQPFLAVASTILLVVALRSRLRNATSCPVRVGGPTGAA